MTQENKKLLLKELCARLPYGVICEDGYGNVLELNGIDKPNTVTFKCSDNTFCTADLDKCKPYLFPLSSMDKKQTHKFLSTCNCYCEYYWTEETFDWLNAHHFDYRGFIEKGLALDATGLNIY